MKLLIPWEQFSQDIDALIEDGQSILEKQATINSNGELADIESVIEAWATKSGRFLLETFDEKSLASSFSAAHATKYRFGNRVNDFNQEKKEIFDDFTVKLNCLISWNKILSVSDSIIKSDLLNLQARSHLQTNEVLDLILDKLYDLYDNYYYSLTMILEGNGITLKRHGEERELSRALEEQGYIKVSKLREVSAQLTLEGKMYVEEKRQIYVEDYSDIKSQQEVDKRIDEVLENLATLKDGQEIIFEEIEELKELYTRLNKKNWGQIVKGKLIDLALAKLIENDTVTYIYETLTDHKMRLP
jgi:Ca2+-binding EF-hand superfamily protein